MSSLVKSIYPALAWKRYRYSETSPLRDHLLYWREASIHGTLNSVLVTSIEGTRLFREKGHFFWVVKPSIRDKSSWHTCLKLVLLLSTISSIYYFILFKYRKSIPPPPNHPQERLEGLNTTLILEGGGKGTQGEGIGMSTVQKGCILKKCLNTFVPHCGFNPYSGDTLALKKWLTTKITVDKFNCHKSQWQQLPKHELSVSLKIGVPHLWEFNTQYCRDKLIIIFYTYPAAWNNDPGRFRGRIKEKYFILLVNN